MPRARWFISTQELPDRRTPTSADPTTHSVHVTRHYFVEHPAIGPHPVRFLQELYEFSILPVFRLRQYLLVEVDLRILRFVVEVFPTSVPGG